MSLFPKKVEYPFKIMTTTNSFISSMSKLVVYEDPKLSSCRKVSIHFPPLCGKQCRKFI